jgi:hypothetical protein
MSTSNDFEECYIIYSTIKWIRVTNVKKNKTNDRTFEFWFEIRCAMDTFQVNNKSIRARHRNLFKNNDYDFYSTRDFVMSIPFNSVNGLTPGKWTNLYKKWINSVHQTL